MRALDACPADVQLRLAVLLHDVGKPAVRALGDRTADYTFYQHEAAGARLADAIALRLRLSNDDRARLVGRVRNHLVVYGDDWTDAAVRRWVRRVGPEEVEPMLAIARADAAGKGSDPSAELERIERLRTRAEALAREGMALSARDLAVDGRELMRELGIAPGPLVGRILAGLLEAVIEEPEANEPGRLLARARELMAEPPPSPDQGKQTPNR
jgi:tRNA nucleotidyltransferase (CCA-adding enzyme)